MFCSNFFTEVLPVWLQAILAAWAIFISLKINKQQNEMEKQGKKIQDLANIVSELKNQNIILEKRFQIEKLISIMDRMPFFKLDHYDKEIKDGIGFITLHLHNIGVDASDLQIHENRYDHYSYTIEGKTIDKGRYVKIILRFKDDNIENVDFKTSVKSVHNIEIRQRVHKLPGEDFTIDSPEDVI
jgi:hypothetical protein